MRLYCELYKNILLTLSNFVTEISDMPKQLQAEPKQNMYAPFSHRKNTSQRNNLPHFDLI